MAPRHCPSWFDVGTLPPAPAIDEKVKADIMTSVAYVEALIQAELPIPIESPSWALVKDGEVLSCLVALKTTNEPGRAMSLSGWILPRGSSQSQQNGVIHDEFLDAIS